MNRRAIEAIDYRLQVVDAMQKNGGLDVPSIGNVATEGGKFERLLCAIEFQKKKWGSRRRPVLPAARSG
jgi:hypothetical protein